MELQGSQKVKFSKCEPCGLTLYYIKTPEHSQKKGKKQLD